MIVVIGSHHDRVATDLVAAWPEARLCSAQDLLGPGWVWPQASSEHRTWVVAGNKFGDDQVTGVFLRRSTVYAEELVTTHPDDRVFLASQAHAFLTFILATTKARVVNPVCNGAFGEEALGPERWTGRAREVGITVRPIRVTTEPQRRRRYRTYAIEVVGGEVFGEAPARIRKAASQLAYLLELSWATFVFDMRHRLITLSAAYPPSDAAAASIGRLLKAERS